MPLSSSKTAQVMSSKLKNTGLVFGGMAMLLVVLGWHCAEKKKPEVTFQTKHSFHLPKDEVNAAYPFINLNKNQLVFPSDSSAFDPVYSKLDQILFEGTGSLSILHMGGSHVQAGAVGHRMRELFDGLAWGLTEERGLMFPFRVAHTNSTIYTSSSYEGEWEGCRCAHRKHHCDWGMSGMVASSVDDSSSFKTWAFRTDSTLFVHDKVSLFYNVNTPHFEPEWSGTERPDSSLTDSTLQCKTWFFNSPIDTMSWTFVKQDSMATSIEIKGVLPENSSNRITYHEIGVNGASTSSYLRCEEMESQLKAIVPDLVVFGIGINDAHVPESSFSSSEFIKRYDELVRRCRAANPSVQFLFLTNNDSYYRRRRPNPNGLKVQEAMYQLAEKHDAAVWDLFEIMGGYKSVVLWDDFGLAKSDKIHFTRKGYYLQAELMYDALMESYGAHLMSSSANDTGMNLKSIDR